MELYFEIFMQEKDIPASLFFKRDVFWWENTPYEQGEPYITLGKHFLCTKYPVPAFMLPNLKEAGVSEDPCCLLIGGERIKILERDRLNTTDAAIIVEELYEGVRTIIGNASCWLLDFKTEIDDFGTRVFGTKDDIRNFIATSIRDLDGGFRMSGNSSWIDNRFLS